MRNILFILLSMTIFCRFGVADQIGGTADTNRVFQQCSNASADSKVVEECVDLLFEEAEGRLQKIEREWKFFGDAEVQAARAVSASVESPEPIEIIADNRARTGANELDANQPNVISIVNDQALQSGAVPDGTLVNIDDEASESPDSKPDESEKAPQADAATVAASERFRFLPALFRSYRDQHCAWQATLFGEDRSAAYRGACLTAMTQARALALHASLAEVRAISTRGKTYKGFYVVTDSGATFQACDRTSDWWVIGTDDGQSQLDTRAEQLNMITADIAYAEVGGKITSPPAKALAAGYRQALQIESVNVMRSVAPSDCAGKFVPTSQGEDGLSETAQADAMAKLSKETASTTVEDLSSAGFLYGYFNQWVSACAVTDTSVCSAETEAVYATDGDWVIKLDRSEGREWRVRLIPTTDDHRIDNRYVVSIDDFEVFLGTEDRSSVVVPMNEGIDIASGELARELIVKLRAGQRMQIAWQQADTGAHELNFSLLGVTAALKFFDQQEP